MSKNTEVLNTVQDLVELTIRNKYLDSVKFNVQSYSGTIWDDPEAGEAWLLERAELENKYSDVNWFTRRETADDPERYDEYEKASNELYARKPVSRYGVTSAILIEQASRKSYRTLKSFILSLDLYETIIGVMTPNTGSYNSRFYHALTLKSLVNRLGKTDIGDEIKAAREKEENELRLRKLDNQRKRLLSELETLTQTIDKSDILDIPEQDALNRLWNWLTEYQPE